MSASSQPIPPYAADQIRNLNINQRATIENPYCYVHCSKCGVSKLWGNLDFYKGFMNVRTEGMVLWKKLRPTVGHRLTEGVYKIFPTDLAENTWSLDKISPHNCEDTYAMSVFRL